MRRLSSSILLIAIALAAFAAKVDVLTIPTALVPGEPMAVTVITPDDIAADATLPVVYILHGYDGDHTDYVRHMGDMLREKADAYGMIFVMPDGRDSWYWDAPANPEMKMESFIISGLVPFIDASYPTAATPQLRAITGLSMGGQGAMWLAMRHSDIFGSVASMSGGLDIRPFPNSWKMKLWLGEYAGNPEVWDQHSIVNIARRLTPGQLNILFDCGVDDFFAPVNEELHRVLLNGKIPHDYISRPGAHTWEYWANALPYHLHFFNEIFRSSAEK